MANGIIAPLIKGTGDNRTLSGSLISNGFLRAPGSALFLSPVREKDGSYRTGLDENAEYIKYLSSGEQEIEKARVKSWREKCENYFHVPLGPRDKFYTDMFLGKKDQTYCPFYKLHPKEEMVFDLEDPEQLIIFAYLRVHDKYVAPSFDSFQMGKVKDPALVSYYVKDQEVETSVSYKKNQEMNKAIAALENMSTGKRRSVARVLGLGVGETSTPEFVYNTLNAFIKQGVLEQGYYKGKKALELFMSFNEMKDDNLKVLDMISLCIEMNILRQERTGIIKKGDEVLGANKEKAAEYLLSSEGRDMGIALRAELDQKKTLLSK